MEKSSLCLMRSQIENFKMMHLSLQTVCILANSADPDEMPSDALLMKSL